jgi:hypothetical protein
MKQGSNVDYPQLQYPLHPLMKCVNLLLQVWWCPPVGHLCRMGRLHGGHPLSNGRLIGLLAHLEVALGRVSIQVLQRRRLPLCPLLIRGHFEIGRDRRGPIESQILEVFWESPGSLLGVSWESPGSLLGVSWESPGSLLGVS